MEGSMEANGSVAFFILDFPDSLFKLCKLRQTQK